MKPCYPQRVVCLTEESVEFLYLLGLEDRIVGVSAFVKRPAAAQKIKKVSGFTNANLKKIVDLRPDLILGFSDIQKDIAKDLIALGLDVYISNQRSIGEILNYLLRLGGIFGQQALAQEYVEKMQKKISKFQNLNSQRKQKRPKVYIEEWDHPTITGIKWFSEMVEICGGEPLFKNQSNEAMAKDRFVSFEQVRELNPDIILACWCGKKVDRESIKSRPGWRSLKAVENDRVFELEPEVFLQPGPALFEDGLEILSAIIEKNS